MSDYTITLRIDYQVYEEWRDTLREDEEVSERIEALMMNDFLQHYFDNLE